MAKRRKYTVGEPPNTITILETKPGGPIQIRAWDSSMGRKGAYRKRSLAKQGIREWADAVQHANEQHEKLLRGDEEIRAGAGTLARIFSIYEAHRTPQKKAGSRREDRRCSAMWTRVLGAKKDPHRITRREWEEFARLRRSGAINSHGEPMPEDKRRPVRARPVENDLKWLRSVPAWAVSWQDEHGRYLLRENCCRGFPVPKEKNPRRPVADDARVEAIRKVAPRVSMVVSWSGKKQEVPSPLWAVFEVAVETGRRLGAIVALRWSDVLWDRGPHGSIHWRAASDKMGRESIAPVSASLRDTLNRMRREEPGVGEAPLFPSPKDRSRPVDIYLASKWLRQAEQLAELESMDGSLWHAYRRRWATVRKRLPAVDVAEAGGWAGPHTLQTVYQRADEETMYEVVEGGGVLRAVR